MFSSSSKFREKKHLKYVVFDFPLLLPDQMSEPNSQPTTTHATNRFKGKNIIITGGAGNIGRATATRMAKEGANIIIFDLFRTQESIDEVTKEMTSHGVEALGIHCDVSDHDSVVEAVQKAVDKFTHIDYLFNNAGYQGHFQKTELYPVEDFKKVMDINALGVFNVLTVVAQHMKETSRGGVIVNNASMAGVGAPPNMIAYAASKAAVLSMTRVAAKDLAPLQIRVNSISPAFIGPGLMWTRQVELQAAVGSQYYDSDPLVVASQMISAVALRRYGTLDEVSSVVAFLFSDDASYLTGENLQITGGH